MKRFFLYIIIIIIGSTALNGQSPAPIVHSYTPFQMGAGDTNWGVTQDKEGRILVGNRNGLLEFDGASWRLYKLPSAAQLVRSVYFDARTERIYVGAFEEFGYYERNRFGLLEYTSLSKEMETYKMQNDEIWNILEWQGKIVFQSFSSFFVYDGKEVLPVRNNGELYLFFFSIRDGLYTYERTKPLAEIDGKNYQLRSLNLPPIGSRVIGGFGISPRAFILVTERSGILRFDPDGSKLERIDDLGENFPTANRVIRMKNGDWVIGTTDRGVYNFSPEGALRWHMDRENGLPNNTVQNLFEDKQGNLWVASEKGVAQIFTNSPFKILVFSHQNIGSIFSAGLIGNRYYLGTNTGLYTAPREQIAQVERHPTIRSQVWEISDFDNQCFIGTNQQTFCIENGKTTVAASNDGGMTLQHASINGQDVLVQGTYSDICIYRKNSIGKWTFSHLIPNFWQPIRHLEVDYQGNIWGAHLRKGLYKVTLSNDLSRILSHEYFPTLNKTFKSEELIYVNKIDNRVVLSNDSAFYIYNEHEKKIIPYDALNGQLGAFKGAQRIIPAEKNQYWIIKKNAAALVYCEGEHIEIRRSVNLTALNSFFVENEQNIVPLGGGKHLFCLENGFAFFDEHFKPTSQNKPDIFISEIVTANSKGLLINQEIPDNHRLSIPYNASSVSIRCAYPDYTQGALASMHYRLIKDRKPVSEGSLSGSLLTLSALSPGEYSLLFYVQNDQGTEIARYEMEIVKHEFFLFTPFAYLFYLIATGIGIYLWMRSKQRKMLVKQTERQKAFEREQKERIVQLENEKLSTELSFKGKELASYALNKTKQNQVLREISEELKEQKLALGQQYPNKFYNKLMKLVEDNLSTEDDWKVFEQNFDLIHEHFFRNLRRDYPELTPGDLRLCGYLRLNLSTKEIAELMSISVKSVEVARYRLRKKLQLPDHQSLIDFMIGKQ